MSSSGRAALLHLEYLDELNQHPAPTSDDDSADDSADVDQDP